MLVCSCSQVAFPNDTRCWLGQITVSSAQDKGKKQGDFPLPGQAPCTAICVSSHRQVRSTFPQEAPAIAVSQATPGPSQTSAPEQGPKAHSFQPGPTSYASPLPGHAFFLPSQLVPIAAAADGAHHSSTPSCPAPLAAALAGGTRVGAPGRLRTQRSGARLACTRTGACTQPRADHRELGHRERRLPAQRTRAPDRSWALRPLADVSTSLQLGSATPGRRGGFSRALRHLPERPQGHPRLSTATRHGALRPLARGASRFGPDSPGGSAPPAPRGLHTSRPGSARPNMHYGARPSPLGRKTRPRASSHPARPKDGGGRAPGAGLVVALGSVAGPLGRPLPAAGPGRAWRR